MLKLLLVTLGTWSVVSVFLVGALGFLIDLREQRACAMGWRYRRKSARYRWSHRQNQSRASGSDEEKRQTKRAESGAYR
jgi:hypothetical protein